MRTRALPVAALALACCACADPPEQRPACTASELDGATTVTCADGTSITVRDGARGGGCAIAILADGRRSLECADGTTITLDEPPPPGRCWAGPGGDGRDTVRCDDGTGAPIPGGADAAPCAVEPGPGDARTVSCPDGTRAIVADGGDGSSCAVVDNGDGTRTVACDDGTIASVRAGEPGTACTLEEGPAGARTLTCPDGSRVIVLDGDAGVSCGIELAPSGAQTIRCEDGTTATVGGGTDASACDVSCAPDGTCTVSCPDGTTIAIVPGAGPGGSIRGSIVLFPAGAGAGATIRAEGTSLAVTADALGSFELGPLAAGLYHLSIDATGFATGRVQNVPVLGGRTALPPVTLRRGARILAGEGIAPVRWSADGSRLLLQRSSGAGSELWLHEVAGGRTTQVAVDVAQPRTDPELSRVVFVRGSELVVREPLGAGVERVLARVSDPGAWWVAEDVRSLARLESIQYARVGRSGELVIQSTVDGSELARSPAAWPLPGHPPGGERFVFLEDYDTPTHSGAPAVWDAAAGLVRRYAGAVEGSTVRLPTGRHRALTFVRGSAGGIGGELVVVDLDSGAETVLGPVESADEVLRSHRENALAYRDDTGSVVHFDLDTRTRSVAGLGYPWAFSEDAGLLLGYDSASRWRGPMDLWVWDRTGGARIVAPGLSDFSSPAHAFSPDGRYVAFVRNPTSTYWYTGEIVVHDLWTGIGQVASPAAYLSSHGVFGAGGDAAFLEDFGGLTGRLVRFDPATGSRSVLAESSASVPFWRVDRPDRRRLLYARDLDQMTIIRDPIYWHLLPAEVRVVDPTTGAEGTLCSECDIGMGGLATELRVAGDRVVAHDQPWAPGGGVPLVSFDLDTLTSTLIDEAADEVALHPSGLLAYEVYDVARPDRSGAYVGRLP